MRFAYQALYYPSSAEKIGQFSLPAIRETGPGKNLQAITVSTAGIATD